MAESKETVKLVRTLNITANFQFWINNRIYLIHKYKVGPKLRAKTALQVFFFAWKIPEKCKMYFSWEKIGFIPKNKIDGVITICMKSPKIDG